MPACPVCRDDFEDGVEVCPTDGADLLPTDELPPAPVGDAPLGVFHPVVGVVVAGVVTRRGTPLRVVEVDEQRVELRVPAPERDPLRADLTVNWGTVVAAVPEEDRAAVHGVGDRLVGWHDAPRGSWVDRDGRLRVDAGADEEAVIDASRRVGPALVVAGTLGLLLAWISDGGEVLWLASGAALLLGLLLPL